jgi:hypothetical protein
MESGTASSATQAILQKIATSDKDAYIRFAATSNIGALGEKARSMTATLTKLTKDRDASVSMAARTGLALIGGATVWERNRIFSTPNLPEFIGEINSSITREKLVEKIHNFNGALSNAPFHTLPTHPDFCGFAVPVLMNYINKSGERMPLDKRYAYDTLSKMGHYANPTTAWILMKASRDADGWGRSSASQSLLTLVGIKQRY